MVAQTTIADFGGGGFAEALLLGTLLVVLAVAAFAHSDRVLIPANGFYEYTKPADSKQKLKDKHRFDPVQPPTDSQEKRVPVGESVKVPAGV